jgi:isopentenyl-diphosphate delta-isomerase
MKEKIEVILVDQSDQEIGTVEKVEAHIKGLLHRAFSVFIFRKRNEEIELLLQQRADQKYHSGGLWSNTCCSHAKLNTPIEKTARERMAEEMGFSCPLTNLGLFYYHADLEHGMVEHEIDHVFIGQCNPSKIPFNQDEVQDYRWISYQNFEQELKTQSEKYTAWLPLAWGLTKQSLNYTPI